MRWIFTLLLYSLIPLQPAWCGDITLRIGTHNIQAAIANTAHSREQGLMQHTRLCDNCGMLFVFPKAGKYSFWMKDTPLPLSIAFIASDGSILDIAEMQANTLDIHGARWKFLYALEMPKNWFSKHRISAKDRVEGLQQAPAGQ